MVDPFTNEELGRVLVVKAKLAASQVYDKFTIATTRWTEPAFSAAFRQAFGMEKIVDEGELRVRKEDIQPWKAKSEIPVQVGDVVEVEVAATPKAMAEKPPSSDDSGREKEARSEKVSTESEEQQI